MAGFSFRLSILSEGRYDAQMVTIHDIARETGVSPNTVARILGGRRGRPYNEGKVLKAARRLGYVRNLQASNLRSGRSGLIGLLVPDIRNPQHTEFFQLLQDAANPMGFQILLFSSGGRMRQELHALQRMEQSRVDGLILNASEGETDEGCDDILQRFLTRKTPVVLAGRPERTIRADEIVIDNHAGMRNMVRYLAKTGRTKIAFVCGDRQSLATRERHEACLATVKKLKLEARTEWSQFGEYTPESGAQQTARLLQMNPRPDAIVAGNDLLAAGALRVLLDAGVRVPDDVAVTGFDDIPLASLVSPRLTTLRQPREKIAREVMELLQERITTRSVDAPKKLHYEPELVVRQSA